MSDKVKLKIAAVLAAVVLVAGATVAIVWVATKDPAAPTSGPAGSLVRIEVRSMPEMEIALDGKKLGKTPISVRVPRGDKALKLEASYVIRKYQLGNLRNVKEEPHTDVRMIVPDRDLTIDFAGKR